ncbi:MAG: IS66 family insertion sequence element accessory protein TnpB [Candidatus Latescibacteria bacterium]|nr:IS66 family insertion sequence element accessory protein TnpB [Candidatus Latescibacterota bacterium]
MLLNPDRSIQIYLCLEPTDMRRSFDKLASMAEQVVGHNLLSGNLFVFVSRKRTKLKILFWDRTGYCQYFKRLENGLFSIPYADEGEPRSISIGFEALQLLLDGIDCLGAKRMRV